MTEGTKYILDRVYRVDPRFLSGEDLEWAIKHIRNRHAECVDDLSDCALLDPLETSKRMGVDQVELMGVKKSLMDRLELLLEEFGNRKRVM